MKRIEELEAVLILLLDWMGKARPHRYEWHLDELEGIERRAAGLLGLPEPESYWQGE